MASMSIIFDGFEELADQIMRSEQALRPAVDEALKKTQRIIQDALREASAIYAAKGGGRKGYATGRMFKTIIDDNAVTWEGTVATINAGFEISKYRESIFVMYGTPRMAPDAKVFNAIFGERIQSEIEKAQEEILTKYLQLGGAG